MPRLRPYAAPVAALAGMLLPPLVPPAAARPAEDSAPVAVSAEDERFFENEVRPLLHRRCVRCHGERKQKSGLRLDRPGGARRGGSSGPAVVPGEPETSLLVQAVRYEGEVHMPPDRRLRDREVELLVEWVRRGAPWPGAEAAAAEPDDAWREHWAFLPIRDPAPPAGRGGANPVDRFVRARLAEHDLRPAPRADRRTLIRRLSFDLRGLPPAPGDVEAFLADDSPDAFARLVDRYLASPRYGERWGRHWLDVARYADTKGYVFTAERRFPFSYTYRDWVIRALNEDMPYERFVTAQIAADRMELEGDDRGDLAALGYLTLGRRFLNNRHDIIDDRIDVVTRGFLGLTVQCARCHDHKYDPIPTEDYYALYGVFASTTEPEELPLIAEPEANEAYEEYRKELERRERELEDFVAGKHRELLAKLRSDAGRYLLATRKDPADADFGISLGEDDLRPRSVRRWKRWLEGPGGSGHPVLAPWHAAAALPAEGFAAAFAEWLERARGDGDDRTNPAVLAALREAAPATLDEVAGVYGRLWREVVAEWRTAQDDASGDPPEALPDAARDEVRRVLYGEGSPAFVPREKASRYFDRATRNRQRELRKAIDTLQATSPAAPPRAMAIVDREEPVDPRIFVRGNPARRGARVERRFLTALSGGRPEPFEEEGSGRLELARAITRPENPLTARVIVNRVWLHHFGGGLVGTPSDFGTRSDPPSHPELLDWLASRFLESGGSLKALHRTILLSETWRQTSDPARCPDAARAAGLDPANRLLWRGPRRRLEFEPLRDALLEVSGRLDLRMGGASVDLFSRPWTGRRSIYGFIERQNLPAVLRVFDFASPDATTPARHETVVPQQALWLMNSPFVVETAIRTAARPDIRGAGDTGERIRRLWMRVLRRPPRPGEVELARRFIEEEAGEPAAAPEGAPEDRPRPGPWARLAHTLLVSNEFTYTD